MNMHQHNAAVADSGGTTPGTGTLFTRDTQAIFWNNHQSAIQHMLDYDTLIGRARPSATARY